MRLPRADAARLRALLSANPRMSKSRFIEAYAQHHEPDIDKLIEQDINRRATAFIARQKGKDGIRKAFIVEGEAGQIVVNIELTKELDDANAVVNHLQNAIDGRVPALNKAKRRRTYILGQTGLFTYDDEMT